MILSPQSNSPVRSAPSDYLASPGNQQKSNIANYRESGEAEPFVAGVVI